MCGPPDAEMRSPAAANGRASRRGELNKKPEEITEATAEIQARSLRRHFAVGYCLAASIARLVSDQFQRSVAQTSYPDGYRHSETLAGQCHHCSPRGAGMAWRACL